MAGVPDAIFKYVGPERIDIIKNFKIRFTQPSCCNDPFEAQLCIDPLEDEAVIKKHVAKLILVDYRQYVLHESTLGKQPASLEKFRQRIEIHYESRMRHLRVNRRLARERAAERVRKFWDDLGLLSLTATENNLLMWAHYTDGHKGMVIEFDAKHPFLKLTDSSHPNPSERERDIQFGALTPVVYSSDRPRHHLGEIPQPVDFFTKSPEWSYEREWRVVRLLAESDSQKPTPQGTVHLFAVPPECIKRVVMGCCMEQKTRTELLNAFAVNPTLRHVQIEEAKLDLDTFRLNYVSSPNTRRT